MKKLELELLELVKDFTNKELVEGCLIKNKNGMILKCNGLESKRQFAGCDDYYKTLGFHYGVFIPRYLSNIELEDYKNLGQLDITAVTRCIESKLDKNTFLETTVESIKIIEIRNKYNTNDFTRLLLGKKSLNENDVKEIYVRKWSFPNKPINTYTDEELKDLINNLKELGTQ